jgi:hypothetical protein
MPSAIDAVPESAVQQANAATDGDGAALYLAAYNGDSQGVADILAGDANLLYWRHPDGGASALYVAVEFGHERCAKLLIDACAPLDAARDDGATPLYKACMVRRQTRTAGTPHAARR